MSSLVSPHRLRRPHGLVAVGVALAAFALVAPRAEARGAKREGFNFGTTVDVVSRTDRSQAGDGQDRNARNDSTTSGISPYVGYAFGPLNLGLVYATDTTTTKTVEDSADGNTTTTRTSATEMRGMSLFARFLFGTYFFFEGGGGLYEQTREVTIETKVRDGEGAFTGNEDHYSLRSVGPGYHAGGGLELPMGAGFFFTTAYQVRIVQLRDPDGDTLGRKRAQSQKREVLFGLAYYNP
jgi:hypothetical protein